MYADKNVEVPIVDMLLSNWYVAGYITNILFVES
jgi:hypothetical protein